MKKLPKTIFVTREKLNGVEEYLVINRDVATLLSGAELDGEIVGVYELKEVKRIAIKKALVPR